MNTANRLYRPDETPDANKEMARTAIDEFNSEEYEQWGRPENVPLLLRMMENADLTPEQFARLLQSRYQVAHHFVALLERAMQLRKAEGFGEDDPLYDALHRNFLDETGGYDCEPPHEQGRRDALEALGVQYEAWLKNPAPSSQHFLEEYGRLMSESSLAAGTALLYYEGRIHRQGRGDYYRLLKGLETSFPHLKKDKYRSGDALYHIASHARHDEGHERELIDGVVSAVNSKSDAEETPRVLVKAQLLWNAYWELLCEEILGKPIEEGQIEILRRARAVLDSLHNKSVQ